MLTRWSCWVLRLPRTPGTDGRGFSTVFRDDPKRVNVGRESTTEMRPVEYVPSIRSWQKPKEILSKRRRRPVRHRSKRRMTDYVTAATAESPSEMGPAKCSESPSLLRRRLVEYADKRLSTAIRLNVKTKKYSKITVVNIVRAVLE